MGSSIYLDPARDDGKGVSVMAGCAIRRAALAGLIFLMCYRVTTAEPGLLQEGISRLEQAVADWDGTQMGKAAEMLRHAAETGGQEPRAYYWLAAAHYQLAAFFLHGRSEDQNPQRGKEQVDLGLAAAEQAVELAPDDAESLILRGVLSGMKIQEGLWQALTLGPRVEADRNRALELAPENPRVHYLTGLSLWFAPEGFGDRGRALEQFLKAETLFEQEAGRPAGPYEPRWGRVQNLAFIGDVYSSQGDIERARDYYRRALALNPGEALASQRMKELEAKNKP